MKREALFFKDKGDWLNARLRDITSTEIAALFGVSKYMTPYKLWYVKKNGLIKQPKQNDRMSWGIRLQDSIAYGIGEDHGFKPIKMEEYIRLPDLRIASSFDFRIGDDTLFEIKNVGADYFQSGWNFDSENARAPEHIELQVQHQLLVSGFKLAYIGALVGGNRPYLLRRERNEELIGEMLVRCAKFWESVDASTPPDPDLDLDYSHIPDIFNHAEPKSTGEGDDELKSLVGRYWELSAAQRSVGVEKDKVKAQMLLKIGSTETVDGDGYRVVAGMVPEKEMKPYTRSAYRSFKVLTRREKECEK